MTFAVWACALWAITRSAGTAVCIVGAMRGFSHPNVTRSLKHVLQQLSCDNRVDVFLYLKLNEICSAGASCGAAKHSSFSTDELGEAVRAMQPVALDLDDRLADFPASGQARFCNGSDSGPVCLTGHEYSCKFAQQFDKIRKCYEMVMAYEERMRIQYSWVARLRPDISLQGQPQFNFCRDEGFSRVERYHNGLTLGDHFARLQRRDAHIYFKAAFAADHCVPLQQLQKGCHAGLEHGDHVYPECLLTYHIRLHEGQNMPLRLADRTKQTLVKGNLIRSDHSLRDDLHAWW